MNIIDYIRWRGDLSFTVDPFNEVDNLVFSQMIYADFDDLLKREDRMTIRELGRRYFEKYPNSLGNTRLFARDGITVLNEIMNRKRYAECIIYNFESLLHLDTTEQFCACMIDLPDHTTVICFKGTDEHLIGWKEDLSLSYQDIAGQQDALFYVNRHCSIFRKYRLIGHSKGGFLAIYAAMNCKPLIRGRIIQIISNDGPGLRPGTYNKEEFDKVKDKYLLIVPEKDGIGTIYEMAVRKLVARITTKNIVEAHNIMTWQVEDNRIMNADADSYQTDQTRLALLQMLRETTPEQRKIFTEEFFNAFNDAGITTVSQLAHGGLPIILRVLREMSEIDGVARAMALKLLKTFSVSVTSGIELQKKVAERKESLLNRAKNLEARIAEKRIEEFMSEFGRRDHKEEKKEKQ